MNRLRQILVLLLGGAFISYGIAILLYGAAVPIAMLLYAASRNYDLHILIWRRNIEWFSAGAGYAVCLLKLDWEMVGTLPLFASSSRQGRSDDTIRGDTMRCLKRNLGNLAALKRAIADRTIGSRSRAITLKMKGELEAVVKRQQRAILARNANAGRRSQRYVMIDTPSPFASDKELQEFLVQNQDDEHPQVKEAVGDVRRYLAKRLSSNNSTD